MSFGHKRQFVAYIADKPMQLADYEAARRNRRNPRTCRLSDEFEMCVRLTEIVVSPVRVRVSPSGSAAIPHDDWIF
jgi:hypothetical protein